MGIVVEGEKERHLPRATTPAPNARHGVVAATRGGPASRHAPAEARPLPGAL
ncbi:MAG: hypothetical protein M0C28_07900 [Candidatus Moduliflexus flocculans]|nr:hypothetical protein [Candidatus Moduliflexus flocculans]